MVGATVAWWVKAVMVNGSHFTLLFVWRKERNVGGNTKERRKCMPFGCFFQLI
jgi:hypothetical protein